MAPRGKRARLDSGRRTSGEPEWPAEEQAQEGHHADDTGPTQGDEPLQDSSDQESLASPQMRTPDAEESTPHQQTDARAVEPLAPERQGSCDEPDSPFQHTTLEGNWGTSPPPERGCHDPSGQGDEDAYHGRGAQPDDLPGGPNDWSPDNIVPHLEAPRISVDFIKCFGPATSEEDPIPADVRERQWSSLIEPLCVDRDVRLCIKLFLATINEPEPEAAYDTICAAIRCYSPDAQTLSYEQTKRKIAELTGVIPVMTDMCPPIDNSATQAMGRQASAPTTGSDGVQAAGVVETVSSASTTNAHAPKTKNMKSEPMRPGTSKTAR